MDIECRKCKVTKPVEAFWKSSSGRGREATCKQCRMDVRYEQERERSVRRGARLRTSTLQARELREQGRKYCPGCSQVKSIDDFYSSGKSNHGRASHCKECASVLAKQRPAGERQVQYRRDRDKVWASNLKRKFGIDVDVYNELLERQGGVCAICGGRDKKKRLAVDHCHNSGRVRALLCGRCNPAVGFLLDDPELARKMLAYIEEHKNGVSSHT